MEVSRTQKLLFGAVLILSVGVQVPAAHSSTPCGLANAYVEAHLIELAQAEYLNVLKENMGLECAREGLSNLVELRLAVFRHMTLGETYEAQGQINESVKEFRSALLIDAANEEARAALVRLQSDEPEPEPSSTGFKEARALAAAGYDEKASEVVQGALIEKPTEEPPRDLAYLAGQPAFRWRRFIGDPLVKTAVDFVAAGVIGLVAAIALYVAITRWIRSRKPRLHIADFDVGATDLTVSKTLPALLKAELDRFTSERHEKQMTFLGLPVEGVDIPSAVVEVAAPLKFLSALLGMFKPKVHTLNGSMHAAGAFGVGMTLTFSKPGAIPPSSVTIWQRSYDRSFDPKSKNGKAKDVGDFYGLIAPAAAWVLIQWLSIKKGSENLVGEDWESLALFQSGVVSLRRGDFEGARLFCLQALTRDPENERALLNLGSLYVRDGEFQKAISRLTEAKEMTSKSIPTASR